MKLDKIVDSELQKFLKIFFNYYERAIYDDRYVSYVPSGDERRTYESLPVNFALTLAYHKMYGNDELPTVKRKILNLIEVSYKENLRMFRNTFESYLKDELRRNYVNFKDLAKDLNSASRNNIINSENAKSYNLIKGIFDDMLKNPIKEEHNHEEGNGKLMSQERYLKGIINPEMYIIKPKVRFSDIIGYEKQKEEIDLYFRGLLMPDEYKKIRDVAKLYYHALIIGPPGTGKTTFAKAIANEYNMDLLQINFDMLYNKYYGESEKIIAGLLSYVVIKKPKTMLYIDEADSLTKDSDDLSSRILNTMLSMLEGDEDYKDVVVVASTSKKEYIGTDFSRRFNTIILDLPDEKQRKGIFMHYLNKLSTAYPMDEELYNRLDDFARATENMTGDDIYDIVSRSVLYKKREVSLNHINETPLKYETIIKMIEYKRNIKERF